MAEYRQKRKKTEAFARMAGVVAAIAAHGLLAVCFAFSGLKYIYPPPEEASFVLDFTEQEPEVPEPLKQGPQPQDEVVDITKPVEIVKRSEAPVKGTRANVAKASTVDDFGDVDQPKPETEKPIEQRALFHTAHNKPSKDTLAPQTARDISGRLSEGHAGGNTDKGPSSGAPNARLQGRRVLGNLPKPAYKAEESGIVVVTVWVDQYGNVQKAQAGARGTTVTDSRLWNAARDAALKSHFNQSIDAPALQEGTITYKFSLR